MATRSISYKLQPMDPHGSRRASLILIATPAIEFHPKRRLKMKIPKKKSRRQEHLSVGWKGLHEELLLTIFLKLSDDPEWLLKTAYSVCCRWWRRFCFMALFQKEDTVFDLEPLKYTGVVEDGDQLMELFRNICDALHDKLEIVNFVSLPEYFPYFGDNHLCYLAQRFPSLHHVHLPCTTDMMSGVGLSRAIRRWKELETLEIGPTKLGDFSHMIQEVGINCKNLEVLHIYKETSIDGYPFLLDEYTSVLIANNLLKLKTLVLMKCMVSESGLNIIMTKCSCLELILLSLCGYEENTSNSGSSLSRAVRNGKLDCTKGRLIHVRIDKRITEELNTTEWSLDVHVPDKSEFYYSISSALARLRKMSMSYLGELVFL